MVNARLIEPWLYVVGWCEAERYLDSDRQPGIRRMLADNPESGHDLYHAQGSDPVRDALVDAVGHSRAVRTGRGFCRS